MEVDELLILRLGLLGILLIFVLVVALTMSGAVRMRTSAPQPSSAGRQRFALQVVGPAESGIATGTTFELAGIMTIGRSPENSIVIVDPSVSSVHAEVRRIRGSWVVKDLDSTNGTLLGDRPVDGRGQQLRAGDRLTIGAVVLRFQA